MKALALVVVFAGAVAAERALADGVPAPAATCHACHESDEPRRDGAAPFLSSQKGAYLANQLRAFRAGDRKSELMQAIARQLSDADITSLAEYWSTRERGLAAPAEFSAWRAASAELPPDFPKSFRVYKTVFDRDDGTTRQFYANTPAFKAARQGVPLPVGSSILIVTYPGVVEAGTVESAKPAAQGFAVMSAVADAGRNVPALLRNADWRYAFFEANRARAAGVNEAPCLACHQPQAAESFLFTLADLKKAAGT
jgi:cytochrome c553